jgi:hypothetical protein
MENFYLLLGAGMFGAVVKEVLEKGRLKLPKLINGELDLGILGGMFIGAFIGFMIDGSYVTAAMGGYVGVSALENLLPKNALSFSTMPDSIENLIRKIAKEMEVDPDLAVKIAKCESSLNPLAKNINSPDSIDRGIFQINSKYHPEVSEAQAYDPEFSARFFCQAVKDGHIDWWDNSKKCWG